MLRTLLRLDSRLDRVLTRRQLTAEKEKRKPLKLKFLKMQIFIQELQNIYDYRLFSVLDQSNILADEQQLQFFTFYAWG